MYKKILCLLLILLNCVLISCKYKDFYLKDHDPIKEWKDNRESLSKIKKYQVRGSLICNVYEKKKIRLQFFFQNIDHKYCRLVLTDLIGFKSVEIKLLENGKFFIRENIKNCFSFFNFEKFIEKLIYEYMLFKNLREWVIGLPGLSVDFSINDNGYLKHINYQYDEKNFTLSYKSYYDNITPFLPRIIEIYSNKRLYLNIKIYKWIT